MREKLSQKYKNNLITVPFELFVKKPNPFLKKIMNIMETNNLKKTSQILKKQRIPIKKIADSLKLDIYKRCGWKPPVKNLSEKDELDLRRKYAIQNNVSRKMMKLLDFLTFFQPDFNSLNLIILSTNIFPVLGSNRKSF